MGCNSSKKSRLGRQFQVQNFTLALNEVESLYELYKNLSCSVVKDGLIHKEELQLAVLRNSNKQSFFLDRIFDLFDVDGNGHIEFGEFVRSMAVFHPRTPQTDKIKCKICV
ncbi:calcineurin B-like protein 7 isoform X2 [Carica papaya]|uniref:calcineurin B-like protein 7 isoform X2 n=1 Tax=Carica papaya TaxID=3649 RepID=UPI000B8D17E6|nr:calcineurin B-like protein 7 isoform X2 [Carica papaya]